jgi:hypothetical protein
MVPFASFPGGTTTLNKFESNRIDSNRIDSVLLDASSPPHSAPPVPKVVVPAESIMPPPWVHPSASTSHQRGDEKDGLVGADAKEALGDESRGSQHHYVRVEATKGRRWRWR